MRKALRAGGAIVLAYLLQATVLPYFKVRGVQLDLLTITIFALGSVLGMYGGLCAGLLSALILESIGGGIAGITSAFCLGAGAAGAYIVKKTESLSLPGKRERERLIRRFAPTVALTLFVLAKELLFVVYFFLTGVTVSPIHIFRMVFAALEAGVFSLALAPLLRAWLLHKPKTRAEKRAEKAEAFAPPARKKEKRRDKRSFFDDLMVTDDAAEPAADAPLLDDEEAFEGWRPARADDTEQETQDAVSARAEAAEEAGPDDENR